MKQITGIIVMAIKHGMRAETFGTPAFAGFPGVAPEQITIVKPRRGEGTPAGLTGWHIIQFADGGRLCMHESGFRIVDNRAA